MSLLDTLLRTVVRLRGRRALRAFERAARDPRATQLGVLRRILRAQAGTRFGQQHGFAEISGVDDFRARVPLHEYEELRPWIEEQDRTGEPLLNREMPCIYATTSGTTGRPKYLPVLRSTLAGQARVQDLFAYCLLRDRPRLLDGHVLAVVSPAVEARMPGSGIAVGSTSGQIYESIPSVVKTKYVVPPEVFEVEDYDTKYLLILRLALRHRDVTYATTANPSTLVRLAALARLHWDELVGDVERGGFSRLESLSAEVRRAVEGRLAPAPERAAELRGLAAATPRVRLRDLWPDLQAVGVWTGGSSSIFFEQLRGEFPDDCLVRDVGYLSSEFRGAVPVSSETNAGVPSLLDNFFEFAPRDAWDRGEPRFLGLEALTDGEQYYVFVTTDAGLYRYAMNDVVQMDGCFGRTPRLRFIQKGKGVTSLTGEKLYESQLIAAVSKAEAALRLASSFYLATADEEGVRYSVYYEPAPGSARAALARARSLAADLDAALAERNLEYAVKRRSGRLAAPRLVVLRPGAFERYKRSCLARGQREGQFKIVALQYARELRFDFEAEALAIVRPGEPTREASRDRAACA
jgi:hypothetical protein